MLRDSLWHVLWSDFETEHSTAGEALHAVLARHGGKLFGILYERNCRQAFCPTEAFHATALAPDRCACVRGCVGVVHSNPKIKRGVGRFGRVSHLLAGIAYRHAYRAVSVITLISPNVRRNAC